MKYFDTLYRALVDYRKITLEQNDCKVQREAIVASGNDADKIEITRKSCIVEEDWIDEIEKGLEFIEKAIKEERQFIRSNGEVVPIEKVKRVSRDSVEHLARHSNYFTREQEEGKDLVPDQLYTVERLSDYAVYENRFLYMLLCYLRDFIAMRYEKILAVTNTYDGKMTLDKSVVESKRTVKISLNLEEQKVDDQYLREHNPTQKQLDRILTMYKAVIVYLNTPLMIEVAKTPMLKPPIQRTNVLKMNRNFRAALSLYEFVAAYDKDGFTVYTDKKILSPLNSLVADEVAEVVEMASFLSYEHGLGLRDFFKSRYEKEEEAKKEAERQKIVDQINAIGRHLKSNGLTAEEYIMLLQKRLKDLETMEVQVKDARAEVERLEEEREQLRAEMYAVQTTIGDLSREITELSEQHALELEEVTDKYESRITELTDEHENFVYDMQISHAEQMKETRDKYEAELRNTLEAKQKMEVEHAVAVKTLHEKHATAIQEINDKYSKKIADVTTKLEGNVKKVKELTAACKKVDEERALSEARYNAIRCEYGIITEDDDFTSREMIDELEKEYHAFRKFFRKQWSKTRKKLFIEMWRDVFGKKAKEEEQKEKEERKQQKAQKEKKSAKEIFQSAKDKFASLIEKIKDKVSGGSDKEEEKEVEGQQPQTDEDDDWGDLVHREEKKDPPEAEKGAEEPDVEEAEVPVADEAAPTEQEAEVEEPKIEAEEV